MKSLFAALLFSTLIPSVSPADDAAPQTAKKPNIIFFLVDDLGWRDVGFNGSRYYETPNIDRLAAQGMRFGQGYAACAVCSPTRASIMTGQYPARLHLTDWIPGEGDKKDGKFKVPSWRQFLPKDAPTLAEELRRVGYATASVGKWHLGGKPQNSLPQDRGFDVNIAGGELGGPATYFYPYGAKDSKWHVPGLDEDGVARPDEYLTDRLTVEAQHFLEKHHAEHPRQPFFLYMAHYAVHVPLYGKPDLVAKYRNKAPDGGQKNPVYAAMIDSTDQSLGALLATLDRLHLRDDTVIVFTGDNGGLDHPGAHVTSNAPLRGGKGMAYEGGTREATVIAWPGHIPAGENATPILSMDFYPTLLNLAGVKPSHPVDGLDLAPLWARDPAASAPIAARDALFWHYPHYWNGTFVTPFSAVRMADWKLIHFYEDDRWELYDLKNDPGEQKDLAKADPARAETLRLRLAAWLKETGAQLPVPKKR